jgi:hypothetical protein
MDMKVVKYLIQNNTDDNEILAFIRKDWEKIQKEVEIRENKIKAMQEKYQTELM